MPHRSSNAPSLPKEHTVKPAADPRHRRTQQPGLLAKGLTLLITTALLVLGFMFSLLLVAFAVAAAVLAWGYLWWRTRQLRRRFREQAQGAPRPEAGGGTVFEGEAVRVDADAEDERGQPPSPGGPAKRPGADRDQPDSTHEH